MADSIDCAASDLFCSENTNLCFGDLDCDGAADDPSHSVHHRDRDQNNRLSGDRSEPGPQPLLGFPLQAHECVNLMVEREREHLPRDDYLKRLLNGDVDSGFRKEALDWIFKAHAILNFEPLSACLSMNYLDRFLSVHELPKCRNWAVHLLAVACLSLAAKMEETEVPQSVDFQVGEPRFVFDAKPIQRMELLVLSTLNWRMQAFTPFSFIDFFLSMINGDQRPSESLIFRSVQLILSTIRVIDFLEFKSSEIAAAVAIFVSREAQQLVDIDKATGCCSTFVEKDRLVKCIDMVKDLSITTRCGSGSNIGNGLAGASVPQSPVGVLDAAACLSYKSDETTVGSCANLSQNNSPESSKRRRIDRPSQADAES